LASLNNGRPPYPVQWKGCVWLTKGAPVDVVHSGDEGTEISGASLGSRTIRCFERARSKQPEKAVDPARLRG
jgi:hypothetical protein